MKYIIIGNSAAAVGTVEGIRSVDAEGEIELFTSEKYHTYSRPLISYLLCGKTDSANMKYRPDGFYEKNNVKTHFSSTVSKIDAENKTVTAEGKKYSYDRLMAACGSSPFVPAAEGLEKTGYQTFGSLDDALKLESKITPESRVLIIGAGLIGLKCAEGISGRVKTITVVDMADRVLSSVLDKDAADIVQNHLEKCGLKFYLSRFVKKYDAASAQLDDGSVIEFDILVIAVGVAANIRLIKEAGGRAEKGIWTDIRGETSLKDVYAAGDCALSYDTTTDSSRVLALLPNAYMSGFAAGVNMAGGNAENSGAIPMNSIGLMGLHIITAGNCRDGTETVISQDGYKKFVVKNGKLNGFILVGCVDRAGIYTRLVREKIPLCGLDFEKLKNFPTLAAFPDEEREKILEGVI